MSADDQVDTDWIEVHHLVKTRGVTVGEAWGIVIKRDEERMAAIAAEYAECFGDDTDELF